MKRLIMDLDNTVSVNDNGNYAEAKPVMEVIERIREYKNKGFEIVIFSSRNMRTYQGNVGKINANTLPIIVEWLNKHDIPYDEIYVGKPWCGHEGFYVDDRAVRPKEFITLSYDEIVELMRRDK